MRERSKAVAATRQTTVSGRERHALHVGYAARIRVCTIAVKTRAKGNRRVA
jgi:hypothetical protein